MTWRCAKVDFNGELWLGRKVRMTKNWLCKTWQFPTWAAIVSKASLVSSSSSSCTKNQKQPFIITSLPPISSYCATCFNFCCFKFWDTWIDATFAAVKCFHQNLLLLLFRQDQTDPEQRLRDSLQKRYYNLLFKSLYLFLS